MLKQFKTSIIIISSIIGFVACEDNYVPKPKAYLRLDYPKPVYKRYLPDSRVPFSFDKNQLSKKVAVKKLRQSSTESYAVNIEYPQLKGTVYITYKALNGKKENLTTFLRDAQNFTQKHTVKADEILEQLFEDDKRKTYGMFYEVGGNAASQSQFYITDSLNHFITGSLYFYAKPNYDSILPAAAYLKNDIRKIMETVEWR